MTYIRQKTWTFYLTNKTKIRIVKTGEQNHLSLLSAYHRRSLFTEKLSHSPLFCNYEYCSSIFLSFHLVLFTNFVHLYKSSNFVQTRILYLLLNDISRYNHSPKFLKKIYYIIPRTLNRFTIPILYFRMFSV